jgi:hypothetical protein
MVGFPKMKNKNNELIVLLNFLKSGLSTRKLDKLMGFSNTKGWKSWEILKKYNLKKEDKAKLFLYSEQQSNKLISEMIKEPEEGILDELISNNPPNSLEKYKNTFVLAPSEKDFYNIFSGQTRNIIRDFFNPKKKLMGKCQYLGCMAGGEIDTVHYQKERPAIFKESAAKYKQPFNDKLFKFDVYMTMRDFLASHSSERIICFLCKNHHNMLHRVEKSGKSKLSKFTKNIIF